MFTCSFMLLGLLMTNLLLIVVFSSLFRPSTIDRRRFGKKDAKLFLCEAPDTIATGLRLRLIVENIPQPVKLKVTARQKHISQLSSGSLNP